MSVARIFVMSLFTVLILSLGANGIVAAASGVSHEIHCADHHEQTYDHHSVAHAGNLESPNSMTSKTVQHDHETCMFHACPAMFAEDLDYKAEPYLLFTKLQYVDPLIQVVERTESLHRPPNTRSPG